MKHQKSMRQAARDCLLTVATATAVAIGMHVFVYPNHFAPGGVDGLSAMLQDLTGYNAGIYSLLLNVPLLVAAWFILKRRYVLYAVLYNLSFSLTLLLLSHFGMYQYSVSSDLLLPAIYGGVAQGLTGIMLRIGSSSGGVDIVGGMIHKRMPHRNVESIISLVSVAIVLSSFFVYRDIRSVLLSVIEIYVCERVASGILRTSRHAVRFEIVTDCPACLRERILSEIGHGATVLEGQGLYSGQKKALLICLVHYRQIPDFLRIASADESAFVYYSDVMGVHGRFETPPVRKSKRASKKASAP